MHPQGQQFPASVCYLLFVLLGNLPKVVLRGLEISELCNVGVVHQQSEFKFVELVFETRVPENSIVVLRTPNE